MKIIIKEDLSKLENLKAEIYRICSFCHNKIKAEDEYCLICLGDLA